jgi:hypothetical protein
LEIHSPEALLLALDLVLLMVSVQVRILLVIDYPMLLSLLFGELLFHPLFLVLQRSGVELNAHCLQCLTAPRKT